MPEFHPFHGRVSRHFGNSLSPHDAYLSYYDVRLTRDDMACLRDDWLTDNIIQFWEEYLTREYLSKYKHSNIVLLTPSMSQVLMLEKDPKLAKSSLPDLSVTTHIFLPINDEHNPEHAGGGTHWTLLLVSVVDGIAFHYDSMPPGNINEAKEVTGRLQAILEQPLRFLNLGDSPKQDNSSDCGVFVCLNMRHLLLKRLLTVRTEEKVTMSLADRKVDAREGRKEMTRIIESFRKEAEKRRSRSASPHPKKSKSPPRIDSPIQR